MAVLGLLSIDRPSLRALNQISCLFFSDLTDMILNGALNIYLKRYTGYAARASAGPKFGELGDVDREY